MKASTFFSSEQKQQIQAAVKEAEEATSGEVRVHIDTHCDEDVLDRAAWIFKKLEMHRTAERNGVLFYLAVADRKFAVIGDAGINERVPDGFWDCIKNLLRNNFSQGRFTEGLSEGIKLAGRQLKSHFPRKEDDKNELRDEISFDKPANE